MTHTPPTEAGSPVAVPLTKGLRALIDAADVDLVMRYEWQAMLGGRGSGIRVWYASRTITGPSGKQRAQLMHQFLTGWPETDHVNGDGLDNRRANLRPATRSQNVQNSRKRRGASSRYKGVYWLTSRGRWGAQIYIPDPTRTPPKRQIRLGEFSHEDDAGRAYDDAARRYFGEFAALNFPRPGERGCVRHDARPTA